MISLITFPISTEKYEGPLDIFNVSTDLKKIHS
jgi:hypothetical protein